uniref:LRRCT domain-containing protein n=1 Tax=Neogobius melanostomus TaxID=47308 RepID=A0A8C6TNI4_9GOBI
MEIQLEENPWNCTCDLIPLKSWLDTISVFVGDITRSPVPMLCPSICVCTSPNPDSGLHINCQERKLHNISELNPNSLELLHLGNNRIAVIQEGAFENLTNLRRLYLNGNYIESLSQSLFGILDQLSAFIQIDLQENPWDCTCDIVALKNWMELSSTSVVVNEITCDSPSKHAGRLLRSLRTRPFRPCIVPPYEAATARRPLPAHDSRLNKTALYGRPGSTTGRAREAPGAPAAPAGETKSGAGLSGGAGETDCHEPTVR